MATTDPNSTASGLSPDAALADSLSPVANQPTPAATDPNAAAPTPSASNLPSVSDATGTSSGIGSGLSSLASGVGGLVSGAANALGTTTSGLTGAALGLYEAQQQKDQNAALAGQLTSISTPLTTSGLNDLSQYKNFTPTQQAALASGVGTGQTLTGEANPLIQTGQTAIDQYNAGTLQPWQQAQIDQQVAAQKAQLRQSLGANVDSTTLAQGDAAIDQQAAITKGQLMSQNLSTGEQAYGQGTTLQQTGGADITAAYNKASLDISNNLSNALSEITTGLGPLDQAIQLQIQGNTALTGQLQQLFGALAKAGTGTGTAAGGTAAGGVAGSVGSLVSGAKNLYNGVSSLFSGSPAAPAAAAFPTAAPLDLTSQLASDVSAASGLSADAALADSLAPVGADLTGGGLSALADSLAPVGADLTGGGLSALADSLAPVGADLTGGGLSALGGAFAPALDAVTPLSADAMSAAAPDLGASAGAGFGAAAGMLGAAAAPFVLGPLTAPLFMGNIPPTGNPLTGGMINPGDPGYAAVQAFLMPQSAGDAQSLQGFSSPDAAMAAWAQGMAGQSTYQGPPQESYATFVKQYIAQGGDPSKILPQFQSLIGA